MGDVLQPIAETFSPITSLFTSPSPQGVAQSLFAPATIEDQQPGFIGNLSQAFDSIASGIFGGPAGAAGAGAFDTGVVKGGNLGSSLLSGAEAGGSSLIGGSLFGGGTPVGGGGGSLSDFASSDLTSATNPEELGAAINATAPSLGAGAGAGVGSATASGADAAPSVLLSAQNPDQLLGAINATAPSLTTPSPGAGLSQASPPATTAPTPSTLNKMLASLGLGTSAGASPVANLTTPTSATGDIASSTTGSLTPEALAAAPASALTGGASITPTANPGILDTILGFPKAHPLLTLLAGAAGSQLLSPALSKVTGGGLTSQEQTLLNNEQPAISAANSLIPSLQTGILPPGAEASVDSALNADIENIKSRYAALGESGSSAEQQDIANATQTAAGQKFQLAQQATTTGLDALGLNQKVYQTLLQDQLSRQAQLSTAFSNLFSSLGTGVALSGALSKAS